MPAALTLARPPRSLALTLAETRGTLRVLPVQSASGSLMPLARASARTSTPTLAAICAMVSPPRATTSPSEATSLEPVPPPGTKALGYVHSLSCTWQEARTASPELENIR